MSELNMQEFKADFTKAVNDVMHKHFPETKEFSGDLLATQAFNALLNVFMIADKLKGCGK